MKESNINKKNIKSTIEKFQLKYSSWLREDNRNIAILILFLFSLIISYVTIPESMKINYPVSSKDIGTVLKYSVRANRDYTITDENKTRQNRLNVEKNVPLFYQTVDTSNVSKSIKKAFEFIREKGKNSVNEFVSKQNILIPHEFKDVLIESLVINDWKNENYLLGDLLKDQFIMEKDEFQKIIGYPVSSEVFNILSYNNFSTEIEKAIDDILTRLNTYYFLRDGISRDYILSYISVSKNDAIINVPLSKIISGKTLKEEIKHTQKILQQDKVFTQTGLILIAELTFWTIKDNIVFSSELTESNKLTAWNNAPREEFKIRNGEIVKRAGEVISERDIMIFNEMSKQTSARSLFTVYLQNMMYIFIFSMILFFSFKKTVSKFSSRNKDLILISVQSLFSILIFDLVLSLSIPFSHWMGSIDARIFYFVVPFPFVIAALRLLINSETAFFFLILKMAILLLIFPDNFYFPVFYLTGSLAYIFLVTHIEQRSSIIKVSFLLSILLMVLTVLIFLMDRTLPFDNLPRALFLSFFGAMFSGMLLMAVIPVYEWFFGYTTEMTFLEYSTLNHPLMKKMAVNANGTYQHSLTLASIVEVAAKEIGLSSLTCKGMAYFHDIGKLERPEYFTENQSGKNIHDELPSHSMSAMVIINHVKQGLELAKKYRLGEKIEDAVSQHHGTTLVEYFFKMAKKGDKNVSESTYRYSGPKPASRETALLMIADSCEAAVRSIPDKNFQKISDTVSKIVNNKLTDGQLSECNMTLKDLKKIENCLIKTLSGIYHARIEYPDQK